MFFKGLSLFFLGLGAFVIVQVVMPGVSFKVWEMTQYQANKLLANPNPPDNVLGVAVENVGNFPAFVSNAAKSDFPYSEFSVSIPKINLENIKVKVSSNDFEKSLAQLPGSALPGEVGNVFITGHSSLTQFFRPDNFQAIFANLPNIKKGDEVNVEAGGQQFTYSVIGLQIVDPKDTWVINPPDSVGRYLSLMTCVPPGFNTRRLIVLTKLKD